MSGRPLFVGRWAVNQAADRAHLASLDERQHLEGPGPERRRLRRLLVAEDDPTIREALVQLLTEDGYEVVTCENGFEALERLRTESTPDLIILDLLMPVMNGWQFRAAQRSDQKLAEIPVVAVSADDSPQAKAVHADAYLRKPLDGTELLGTIARVIAEADRRQSTTHLKETERLISLGRVASGVGHQINNPLSYVTVNVKILAERLSSPSLASVGASIGLPDLKPLLEDTLEGLERIRRIVHSLQSLSPRVEDALRPVDVEEAMERALAGISAQLPPGARLVKHTAPVPLVLGHAGNLTSLFLHLLTNAVQAIADRGGDDRQIAITIESEGQSVNVSIHDDGSGIPADVLPHIYDPFFTTKPVGKGVGLGLSLCKQIATEHGASMEVLSHPHHGTTVRLRFPRVVRG
jgi:C4-dicarboxylate-specific signal transduction histidine kinase